MYHVWRRRRRMHTGFWCESQKELDQWEEVDVDGRIVLKWILEKYDGVVRTGFI
jgi:hypothetical protein